MSDRRKVDTTLVCTDWKELVNNEWTNEEKVLENNTPQRENLRSGFPADVAVVKDS